MVLFFSPQNGVCSCNSGAIEVWYRSQFLLRLSWHWQSQRESYLTSLNELVPFTTTRLRYGTSLTCLTYLCLEQ